MCHCSYSWIMFGLLWTSLGVIIGLLTGFLLRKAIGEDWEGSSLWCALSPGDGWDGGSCELPVTSIWLMDGKEMVGINGGLMAGCCEDILDGAILLLSLRGGTGGL